jgi:prepilin-type N-terminal cleavage/methylation domain-containing protein
MLNNNRTHKITDSGFTLIELLIVIAIIAIIAGVVFVALDPGKRFGEARNSTRWSDVGEILNAIKINQVDNKGSYLDPEITSLTDGTYYEIGTCGAGTASCTAHTATNCVNLTPLATAGYFPKIPMDPDTTRGTAVNTGYYLKKDALGMITIGACEPENGATIEVVR